MATVGEIPSDDLVGVWRDHGSQQYIYVFSDLSWRAKVLQNNILINIEGQIVVTTKGENEQGTYAVFFKEKGDNGWANVALMLGTNDDEITENTRLQNADLIFKKENP